jgi:hypothetical protein
MFRILIGLAAVWLFAGGFGSTVSSSCTNAASFQRDCKPCKRPDGSLNQSPNVTGLTLDKSELRLKDLPSVPADDAASSPDLIINVATNAEDTENDVLSYYYVVSGGRIIGSGSNVQWDLNGATPGTYTISARVDDSCGVCGKTLTKGVVVIGKVPIVAATPVPVPIATPASVTTAPATALTTVVIARPTPSPSATSKPRAVVPATAAAAATSSAPCSCPTVLISDPERSGSDLIFTTKIFDSPTTSKLTYIWTIVGGSVVSQEGRSIRIKPGVLGGTVKVSINGFDAKCGCPNRAEKSF